MIEPVKAISVQPVSGIGTEYVGFRPGADVPGGHHHAGCWPMNEPASRDWCCGMSYTQHPNH
jgi:hypothetical protein